MTDGIDDPDMPAWLKQSTQAAVQQPVDNGITGMLEEFADEPNTNNEWNPDMLDMDGEAFTPARDATPPASAALDTPPAKKPKKASKKKSGGGDFAAVIDELISVIEEGNSASGSSEAMELLTVFYPDGIKPNELDKAMFVSKVLDCLVAYVNDDDDAIMDLASEVILRLKKEKS